MKNGATSFRRWMGALTALAAALALGACGGGGGGGGDGGSTAATPGTGGGASPPVVTPPVVTPPITVAAPTVSAITLKSDAGDSIGLGRSYSYSAANAKIAVTERAGRLTVTVDGDEHWTADFIGPNARSPLAVGTYANLSELPVQDASVGAFRWFGEGRGCATSIGTVTLDQVAYNGSAIASFILHFERHCDGATAALRGEVRWSATDPTQPVGIVNPVPASLWRPAAGSTPASGNYLLLESDAADPVGLGTSHLFTSANSSILLSGLLGRVDMSASGAEHWTGAFQSMDASAIAPGYYPDLTRVPFYNPVRGGLSWVGEGRGCVGQKGWLVVDRVVYSAGPQSLMTGFDARFEQTCDSGTAALRGAIHWDAPPSTAGQPAATLSTAGSWHAPATVLPAAGNYLYVASPNGDTLGHGHDMLATPLDSVFAVTAEAGLLHVDTQGFERWHGDILLPTDQTQVTPGVYDGLSTYGVPGPNPPATPQGAMRWLANLTACSAYRGWAAIDGASYSAGVLSAVDLRVEVACDSAPVPFRAQLHWRADDLRNPTGPRLPVPAALWQPAAGTAPTTGNYVHLQGDRADFISAGLTTDYTQRDAVFTVGSTDGITFKIDGDEHWNLTFKPMAGAAVQAGYYPGLKRAILPDPAKGAFDFSGEGRSCNALDASVVVDNAVYAGTALKALDLRFEQHCEGTLPGAVRGVVHWTDADSTAPPGPVTPPPATLWRPPTGATPDIGTYVYLQGDAGDTLTGGQTTLASAPASTVAVSTRALDGTVLVDVAGPTPGQGAFTVMSSRTRLEPGYYGQLMRAGFGNPARGSMSWSTATLGCNTLTGWYVVDSVTYTGDAITALDLRFEQHCEGEAPALHGRVRWQR